MLVLLRQNESKLFYGAHGGWVASVPLAAQFQTIDDALLFNRQAHLEGTEIFVLHSNGRHKVVLPVGKETWTSRHWNAPGTAAHSQNRISGVPGVIARANPRRICAANKTARANRRRFPARRSTGQPRRTGAATHKPANGPRFTRPGKQGLLQALASSHLLRDYERAFSGVTGLPLALRSVETWKLPFRGKREESPFCALMSGNSRACAACLRVHQKLLQAAAEEAHTVVCASGLCETAVPVRSEDRLVGSLQTGPVFLKQPTATRFEHVAERVAGWGLQVDRAQLKEAYFETRVVRSPLYKSAIRLLSIFAKHLSLVSHQLALLQANEEPPVITRAKAYIREHQTESLRLGQVAKAVNISSYHFCKVFKRAVGLRFSEYLPRLRIERSKELLRDPKLTVGQIALDIGFQSVTHFNRLFKKLLGMSPTKFRKQFQAHGQR